MVQHLLLAEWQNKMSESIKRETNLLFIKEHNLYLQEKRKKWKETYSEKKRNWWWGWGLSTMNSSNQAIILTADRRENLNICIYQRQKKKKKRIFVLWFTLFVLWNHTEYNTEKRWSSKDVWDIIQLEFVVAMH